MEAGSVVRAVFEFLPSVSEELPLFPGDVIEVLSVVDEFWLLGNKDGVTGNVSGVIITVNRKCFLKYIFGPDTLCAGESNCKVQKCTIHSGQDVNPTCVRHCSLASSALEGSNSQESP